MNIEGKKGCLGVYLRQVRTSNISYQNTAHLKQCIVENSDAFNTRNSRCVEVLMGSICNTICGMYPYVFISIILYTIPHLPIISI